MKARKYWILVLFAGIFGVACWAALASATADFERASLVGLKGVYVVVGIDSGAEKYGLTEQTLQTDVELRLRRSSIKVLSKDEWLKTPGLPLLDITVAVKTHSTPELKGVLAMYIDISFVQSVLLTRDQTKSSPGAITWRKSGIYLGGLYKIIDSREIVKKDYIDKFINDYLEANPKEQPKAEQKE